MNHLPFKITKSAAILDQFDDPQLGRTLANQLLRTGARIHLCGSKEASFQTQAIFGEVPEIRAAGCNFKSRFETEKLFKRFQITGLDTLVYLFNTDLELLDWIPKIAKDTLNPWASIILIVISASPRGDFHLQFESKTRCLAKSLWPQKIRLNSISVAPWAPYDVPGDLQLEIQKYSIFEPCLDHFTTEMISGHALFLADDESRGMTGQVICQNS